MDKPFFVRAYRVQTLYGDCYDITDDDKLILEKDGINHAEYLNGIVSYLVSQSWEAVGKNMLGDLYIGEDKKHYFCIIGSTPAKILPFKRKDKYARVYI